MLVPLIVRKKLTDIYKSGFVGQYAITAFCSIYIRARKLCRAKPYMDINPLAVAVHKYKVLFIGVPKAATQTFLNSFYLDKEIRALYQVELIEKHPTSYVAYESYPDYDSFTLVRNPWARALSCYKSKIYDPDPVKQARTLSLYKGLNAGMSFLDFTRWLLTEEGRDEIADRHWMSQHIFLKNRQGKICCKNIGRFEDIDSEVKKMFEQTGMPPIDLKMRAFKTGASAYQDFYCEESKRNIAERYAQDIDMLGYRFDE